MKISALVLLSGLFLVSCVYDPDKKAEPAPASVKYYPTQVVKTIVPAGDTITTRYTYNAANQVTREDQFRQGALQTYILYTYSAAGNLEKRNYFNASNQEFERYNYETNGAGKITKLSHATVNASGTPTLHHYVTYKFNGNGLVEELTEFNENNLVSKILKFQVVNASTEKVQSLRNDNALEFTSLNQYDLKQHPLSATILNTNNLPGNLTSHTLTDEINQSTVSATSVITYNEAGYPEVSKQQFSDGRIVTETFTYKK